VIARRSVGTGELNDDAERLDLSRPCRVVALVFRCYSCWISAGKGGLQELGAAIAAHLGRAAARRLEGPGWSRRLTLAPVPA